MTALNKLRSLAGGGIPEATLKATRDLFSTIESLGINGQRAGEAEAIRTLVNSQAPTGLTFQTPSLSR